MFYRTIETVEQLIELSKKPDFKGLFEISDEIYFHPNCPGLSRSDIVLFEKSPVSYLLSTPLEPNDNLRFGSAFHMYVLEPLKFLETYKLMPEFRGPRGGVLKGEKKEEAINEWQVENPGKVGISEESLSKIESMHKAVLKNPHVAPLMRKESNHYEFAAFAKCPMTGVILRCKIDLLEVKDDSVVIHDLKTCREGGASYHGFRKSFLSREYGYYWQTVLYKYVVENALDVVVDSFNFICVEKSFPYLNSIFTIDQDSMESGESRLIEILEHYKKCNEKRDWHGYPSEPQPMVIPPYLFE